ncbi:MAG TPA: carboxypeptidase-like regulatory domain-containing protein [Chthoniobacterales bacterium]|nr:carboxypeptidase-like regulatory domain-containing protein [Chthoniobacterales bacterium]
MIIKSLQICFATFLIPAAAAWASPVGPARMEGDVKDSKSQPVAGAEVHLRSADGSGERIVKTDQTGHYGIGNLPVTDYDVILLVNGQVKASLTSIKVFSYKPTLQNFKLTGQYAANIQKKHTHMVYVPAETGSNLSGRWVEVDDQAGVAAAAAGTGKLERVSGAALRRMQAGGNSAGN